MQRELQFIQEAIKLARQGVTNNDGGPFGCVIVKGDHIVGRGWNQVTSTNDPTAHAEVVAIRNACNNLNTFQLHDCEVFTSCEPCPMCMGALYWARPKKVYYASSREDAAAIGFDDSFIYEELKAAIDERKVKMIRLRAEEALELFLEGKNKSNKTIY